MFRILVQLEEHVGVALVAGHAVALPACQPLRKMIHNGEQLNKVCARACGLFQPMNKVGNVGHDGVVVRFDRRESVAETQGTRSDRPTHGNQYRDYETPRRRGNRTYLFKWPCQAAGSFARASTRMADSRSWKRVYDSTIRGVSPS